MMWIVDFLGYVFAGGVGAAAGEWTRRKWPAKIDGCAHIWAPWQETSVRDYHWINGKKQEIRTLALERECLSCGDCEMKLKVAPPK